MWFDSKAALKEMRAARIGTPQNQDCVQKPELISGIRSVYPLKTKKRILIKKTKLAFAE
jgi:hypothetical protein